MALPTSSLKIFLGKNNIRPPPPPGSAHIPQNRMFAQFHAAQTNQMKDEILKQLCCREGIVHVFFSTVAIGMGVDIPDIRQVIHIGLPCYTTAYF